MRAEIQPGFQTEWEEQGSGPVLVLVHGFPLGRLMWRPQLQAFGGEYRCIAPDLRGFGGTSVV